MPYVDSGEARIWYTEQGTGFPMLTLAPGGMRSSVPLWEMASINPLTAYAGQYRMIAMDQRNACQSAGPLEPRDPWGAYAADHLAVMDHLGIDRFLVFGCCIGGPFILKLCELAPERVVAAVLEQPVGIIASNRQLFDNIWKQWAEQLMSKRDDLRSDEIEAWPVRALDRGGERPGPILLVTQLFAVQPGRERLRIPQGAAQSAQALRSH